jgi:hypothetical protein
MATNRNFTNFRAIYDELTDEVMRASPQFLPDHLDSWFALIDETPGVQDIVRRFENSPGIEQYEFMNRLKPSIVNRPLPSPGRPTGPLQWPTDREKRLGMQLKVFREIAKRMLSVTDFGTAFIEGVKPPEAPKLAVDHVFSPMARELRRRLEAELADREDLTVPAADRIVTLDHNSAPYAEAIEAVEKLEDALRGANDFADPQDKGAAHCRGFGDAPITASGTRPGRADCGVVEASRHSIRNKVEGHPSRHGGEQGYGSARSHHRACFQGALWLTNIGNAKAGLFRFAKNP